MDNRKYYECLSRIPGTDHHANLTGFVVCDQIPFYSASDAVKYALKENPNMEPGSDVVVRDVKRCKELARLYLPEIIMQRNLIEEHKKDASVRLQKKAEDRDKMNPTDLFQQVEKDLLQGEIREGIGYHSGLSDAWQILHERIMELHNCLQIKGDAG